MIEEGVITDKEEWDAHYASGVAVSTMTAEAMPAIVRIHREAFAGYMNTRLGDAYIKEFLKWYMHSAKRIALVAADESGQLIGYVVGATLDEGSLMNRDLVAVAARGLMLRPWLFWDAQIRRTLKGRLNIILQRQQRVPPSPQPDLPQPTMSLVGIGVSQVARGKRCGVQLLQAFEGRTRDLGVPSMRLSVYPENSAARRLYERSGWQPFLLPARDKEAMYYSKIL